MPVIFHPRRWQTIALPDDDFMECAWFGETNRPLLVMLHGLEGNYRSHYIQRCLSLFLSRNWQVAVLHFRSCGNQINRRMNSYHSGVSTDLAFAIDILTEDLGPIPKMILGFSLGGNVLLKWLGETGEQEVFSAAMAVSVPFRLDTCADSIDQGFSKFYQKHLIDLLKRKTRLKINQALPGPSLSDDIDWTRIKNFWQFDDLITAPLHGFDSVDDYYNRASSYRYLVDVKTPTLILHALDDPFMSPCVIPDAVDLSSFIQLEISQCGGHVGFLDHWQINRKMCFLANRAMTFFKLFV